MNVAPSTAYEAVLWHGTTGLAGTIRLRTIDNDGAVTQAASSASIAERATGVYAAERTSPANAGQYTLVWDDGADDGVLAIDELNVTSADATPDIVTSNLYVSQAALKATLSITNTTADDDIDLARAAACRAIDAYKGERFYPTNETRYYTGLGNRLDIDPLNSLTSVTVDITGNGSYETTWTNGTDFLLEPLNAATDGQPYRRLLILPQANQRFPRYPKTVQIVGSFGWASAPSQVIQAAGILAARLFKRARETPFGILAVGGDTVAAARLGRIDPDVAFLLDNLDVTDPPLLLY